MNTTAMVGRRVKAPYDGEGEVTRWEPLSSGMCDTLIRFDSGREVWHASHTLSPVGTTIPLPSRRDARKEADERALASLRNIRANHVRDLHKPWPGAEFGKGIIGKALDGAIAEVEGRLQR